MQDQPNADRPVVVHLVHGTWGRGFLPVVLEDLGSSAAGRLLRRIVKPTHTDPHWFEENSAFRQRVLAGVDHNLRDTLTFRKFLWSGSNSLRARAAASNQLRVYLRAAFAESPEACHLVIAHSHGGVVTFDAVTREAKTFPRQIDGILSLATPYLSLDRESVKDNLKTITFAILPASVRVFFVALLALFVLARFHHSAVWLGTVIVALLLTLHELPRIQRPAARYAADVILCALLLGAAWGSFWTAFSWFPIIHPAISPLGAWERSGRYIFSVTAVGLTWLLLFASRATALQPPSSEAFMLRDTIRGLLSLATPVLVILIALWSFVSSNVWVNSFAALLLFWPLAALFFATRGQSSSPNSRPSERWLTVLRTINEESPIRTLPCPLQALRLPGDEASLAIAASLLARQAANLFASIFHWRDRAKRIPPWVYVPITLLTLSGAVVVMRELTAAGTGFWVALVTAGLLVIIGMIFVLIWAGLLLTLAVFCLSLFSIGLLALAVGSEVTGLVPIVRVDCEPLPRCTPTPECRLEFQWLPAADRTGSQLRHSLYDLPLVCVRVAEWINHRARPKIATPTP